MKRRTGGIAFNSPAILTLTFLSLAVLALNRISGGRVNTALAIWYSRWTDPLMYLRMFTHVIVHQNIEHYTGNFLLILAVGPLVEEKYGSKRLIIMFLITAFITGLLNVIFFKNVMLMGASGLVFMLILLASFTNMKDGRIPLTVLLVGVLYIGNEVIAGLTIDDNISRISHIIGGLCGAGFGFLLNNGRR